jgi:hypothetical protein
MSDMGPAPHSHWSVEEGVGSAHVLPLFTHAPLRPVQALPSPPLSPPALPLSAETGDLEMPHSPLSPSSDSMGIENSRDGKDGSDGDCKECTGSQDGKQHLHLYNTHLVLPDGHLSPLTSLWVNLATGTLIHPPSHLPDPLPRDVDRAIRQDQAKGESRDGAEGEGRSGVEHCDLEGGVLIPGLIDIQINGGWGIDFSEYKDDASYLADLDTVGRKLLQLGITR